MLGMLHTTVPVDSNGAFDPSPGCLSTSSSVLWLEYAGQVWLDWSGWIAVVGVLW